MTFESIHFHLDQPKQKFKKKKKEHQSLQFPSPLSSLSSSFDGFGEGCCALGEGSPWFGFAAQYANIIVQWLKIL